jgi:hypothetical protein
MIMKKIFTLIVMMCAALGMQAQDDTWTVAGEKALLGVSWDPTATENDMTNVGGTKFQLVKEGVMLKVKAYEYKFVKNHTWNAPEGGGFPDDNLILDITEDGEYTITFIYDEDELTYDATPVKTGEYVAPTEEQTWTVAGVGPICGSDWNTSDTANDMTSEDGVNYTLTKEGCKLEKGVEYGFKVVADHSWDEAYPASNYMLTVAENGEYTVTITFNKETQVVSAEAVKTANWTPGAKIWTIAGSNANILGSSWDQTDTNNDMTDMGDGTFELRKKNITLEEGEQIDYKVLANHSWTENYGLDGEAGGANLSETFEAGTFDVVFVWNPETRELYVTTEEPDTTAINEVKTAKTNSAVIYNLQGQRVEAGFRGIAIKNGRKVVMK